MGRRPSARKPSFMKILVGDFSKKLVPYIFYYSLTSHKYTNLHVQMCMHFLFILWNYFLSPYYPTQQLIPPKFVRLYRGTLPRKCKLRPSHTQHSWPVRTKQMDNFLYFSKGWRKFARYHSLESHDLLVFRYAQDSEFYVDMFDQSCCSKEPLTSKNMDSRMNTSPTILPSKITNLYCIDFKNSLYAFYVLPYRHAYWYFTGKEKTVNPKTPASSAAEELMASSEFPTFKKVMRPIYVKSGGYLVSLGW